MNLARSQFVGALGLASLASCTSTSIDESDRQAFFIDARVRKELNGAAEHDGMHAELGWTSVEGDTESLDYFVGAASLGLGWEQPIGTRGWIGVVGELSWLHTEFDAMPVDVDGEDSYGPLVAVQGGWSATPWLEPFARADLGLYFPDFNTAVGVEVGARVHVVDPTALFVGWRYARYELEDLDNLTGVDHVELDASGLVVGLEISF